MASCSSSAASILDAISRVSTQFFLKSDPPIGIFLFKGKKDQNLSLGLDHLFSGKPAVLVLCPGFS